MSFSVTFKDETVDFSLDCSLEDIQAYFGVRSGGLYLHGLNPCIPRSKVVEGEAYELQGTDLGPKLVKTIHKKKNDNSKIIVERVEWREEKSSTEEEVIVNTQMVVGGNKLTHRKIKVDKTNPRESSEDVENIDDKTIPPFTTHNQPQPTEWLIVIAGGICFLFFLLIIFWFLRNYDPVYELSLREKADNLTVVNVSIILLSVAFGFIAIFH